MKIIGVDIRVLGTGRISGIEVYTEQILEHMTALSADVHWKLFFSGHKPLTRRSWMERSNISLHETRQSNRLLWLSTRIFGKPHLDTLIGGAEVFFFPHFLLGALSPMCKRVMTWHDLSYERMPYLLSSYRKFWHAFQMRPRIQARDADRIIAVSDATAADVAGLYGIERHSIAVIRSGIDPVLRRAAEPEIHQWREKRKMPFPFVLAVGTREPRKNYPALIRAWNRAVRNTDLAEIHLVIAGQAGWQEGDIHRAINESATPQCIHLIEDIEPSECPLLLSAATVLVYPSLMEGFGFPPLEAMACGTPVIASATSSMFETVSDAALLIDPYRVDGLTGALISLLTDVRLRRQLIERGYERVKHFSWPRAAQSTLSEILSVL